MSIACRKYRSCTTFIANYSLVIVFSAYCLLTASNGFSQIIDPYPAVVSISVPGFGKKFISRHKIKTITASVVNKPDGEIIRDKGLAEVYAFDTTGNLVHHYYNEITSLEKTETEMPAVYRRGRLVKRSYTKVDLQYQYDTLGTEFYYTSNGYLKMQRICLGDFYKTIYYEYFGDGLINKKTTCKETNLAKHGEPFKLGVQTILSEEKFEYENLTPTQVQKKFLNDEGKPYKRGILNFTNGKLMDESYQFLTGYIRSAAAYKYNSDGKLTEVLSNDNSSGPNTTRIVYEYDSIGNVIREKRFINDVQANEVIYLYKDSSALLGNNTHFSLLSSQADRQIQKASIKIIKYDYTFYE